jgi:hypothetical protein
MRGYQIVIWIFISIALLGPVMILVFTVICAQVRCRRQNRREAVQLLKSAVGSTHVITESDLAGLPPPVQHWLRYAGVIGKPIPRTVRLRQRGYFRRDRADGWNPFVAEQYYSTVPPGLLWFVTMRASTWIRVTGRDAYRNGHGSMVIKFWSIVPIANAGGKEIDQGASLRFLNEIMWFPAAALQNYIRWEIVDGSHARATLTNGSQDVSAVFEFDPQGKIVTMSADRYMSNGKSFSLEKWSTPILEYGEMNGLRIPIRGKGVWSLKDGDFTYIHLEVVEIQYDATEPFP